MPKVQLIQKLLENGLFTSRRDAEAYLMAGDIQVDGVRVTRNVRVPDSAVITVVSAPYSGKGGLKLEHAIAAFGIDVSGRVCVDAGASTGGFTDCLLQHGAGMVYAVDVGFGQLTGALRQDARVKNLERTNISDPVLLELDPVPTLGTVDVSYLSLKKAVPYFREIMRHRGELICLVKPLFEIDDPEARRSGIVPDEAYRPVLQDLVGFFSCPGIRCAGITHSPVTGNRNTREFFMHLILDDDLNEEPLCLDDQILEAVEQALRLEPYKK